MSEQGELWTGRGGIVSYHHVVWMTWKAGCHPVILSDLCSMEIPPVLDLLPRARGIPEQTLPLSSLEESTYFLGTPTMHGTQVLTMILMETHIRNLKKASKL